jgi:hypothetical protein
LRWPESVGERTNNPKMIAELLGLGLPASGSVISVRSAAESAPSDTAR